MIKKSINEINIGDFVQIEKKMTLSMVRNFAKISEDFNPIHLDADYAKNSRFKGQIIHGLMAVSLFSGLFGTKLPGEGCVYKSQKIQFKRPIYVGDTVIAKIEVKDVNRKKKIISFSSKCLVNNKIMIEGESEIFIP